MRDNFKKFALNLIQTLPTAGNWFISPYSIKTALQMCSLAADNETATEITKAVGYDTWKSITKYIGDIEASKVITLANSIWLQQGLIPKKAVPTFSENVASIFNSDVNFVNFPKHHEIIADTINEWVANKTKGKINNLVSQEDVTEDTYMCLTSAIYFQDEWVSKFRSYDTIAGNFETPDGPTEARFMHTSDTFGYEEHPGYKLASLEFMSGMDLLLIVPNRVDGLEHITRQVLDEKISLICKLPRTSLHIYMPKFCMQYQVDLISILQQLGIKRAFIREQAQFPYIATAPQEVWIGQAKHKAMCEIDEKGAIAAAVTYVGFSGYSGCAAVAPLMLNVNRPFLYAIRDADQNVLFVGRMENPTIDQ